MGTNFRVPLTNIVRVDPHPNADRLSLATCYGYQIIVGKDQWKVGDECIYIPIDSILPQKLEDFLFPPGSKIDRRGCKRRIRQINIRSFPSQGMCLSLNDIAMVYGDECNPDELEKDYSQELGIEKYEPPEPVVNGPNLARKKKECHPGFHQYGGLENIRWYPNRFAPNDLVQITEKLHGTNARAGILPYNANTWWKKIKRFFGFAPKFENVYGSNCVELQNKDDHSGYYGMNVYEHTFTQMDVFSKLKPNEVVYGEIIGTTPNGKPIQKNYTYGLKDSTRFVLFDVYKDGRWLNPDESREFAKERGFEYVPVLYHGEFNSMDFVKTFSEGPSVYDPNKKVREGCVVKKVLNYDLNGEKQALKVISTVYLADKTNTDDH